MNLGYSDLAYIEGDVPILNLDHFVHAHILREEPDFLYPCCMAVRRSDYLTLPFDYFLVKVLHYSLIGSERHATASQDCLTPAGELVWRQHSRPRLHHRHTLKSPRGTLGMGVATRVTMTVTPSLASELKPPPLPGTLTDTLLWSGMSVMRLTRLSVRWKGLDDLSDGWMTLHMCKRRCKPPSTHRPV
jgi:hypothetical protein